MNQSSFQLKKLGGEVRRREIENKSEESWKKPGKIKVDSNKYKKTKDNRINLFFERINGKTNFSHTCQKTEKNKILSQKL